MRNHALVSSLALALACAMAHPAAAQDVFGISLVEGQEVPATGSLASGTCVARLNPSATELSVICSHDVANVTGAHIHNAAAGVNGPIVFPFASPVSPFRGVWNLTPADVDDLLAGDLYVNVHSTSFPNGEIRGQIGAPATTAFSFALVGEEEVPPTGSAATGGCSAVLNDAQTELTTACFHDVANVTGAHIHNAPPGVSGPIIFPFNPASPFLGVWALSASDVSDLLAGDLYVNVHSMMFPNGEIRGQVLPELIFSDGFESGNVTRWSASAP